MQQITVNQVTSFRAEGKQGLNAVSTDAEQRVEFRFPGQRGSPAIDVRGRVIDQSGPQPVPSGAPDHVGFMPGWAAIRVGWGCPQGGEQMAEGHSNIICFRHGGSLDEATIMSY